MLTLRSCPCGEGKIGRSSSSFYQWTVLCQMSEEGRAKKWYRVKFLMVALNKIVTLRGRGSSSVATMKESNSILITLD